MVIHLEFLGLPHLEIESLIPEADSLFQAEAIFPRDPERRLETPTKTQREVLSAWGYAIDERGVLPGPVS